VWRHGIPKLERKIRALGEIMAKTVQRKHNELLLG
jgi:hypothetical protein